MRDVKFNIHLKIDGREVVVKASADAKDLARSLDAVAAERQGLRDMLLKFNQIGQSFQNLTNGLQQLTGVIHTYTEAYNTLPKEKMKFSIAPEEDAAYLDAVEKGDERKTAEMVSEAAKRAGYDYRGLHASPNTFTVFDKARIGLRDRGIFGAGFYFFQKSSPVIEAYKKDIDTKSPSDNASVINAFIKMENPYILEDSDAAYEEFADLEKAQGGSSRALTDFLIKEGYDGIIVKQPEVLQEGYEDTGDIYVVFDPEQIKSADPVTRDDNGNVIPLSKRFNPKKKVSVSTSTPMQRAPRTTTQGA